MSNVDTLRRSLIDRADALASYLGDLQAGSGRSDDGFARALQMCRQYATSFASEVRAAWDEEATDAERRVILSKHLRSFLIREEWIDERFSRGSQDAIPRALKTMAREEFAHHGLDDHEPVLTVGPPDSFDTHRADLFEHLLARLPASRNDDAVRELRRGPKLSIVSLPYIEGTRALWHPISLGHEIGHIRLDHTRKDGPREQLTEDWWDNDRSSLTKLEHREVRLNPHVVHPGEAIQNRLDRWVDEVLCDLNAVRLFGPAGLSAVAEFLAVQGASKGAGWERQPSATHPPFSLRLEMMFQFLSRLGYEPLPRHTQVWEELRCGNSSPLGEEAGVFASIMTDEGRPAQMMDFVQAWNGSYSGADRRKRISWLASQLLDGIPGATHYTEHSGEISDVEIADVVNAAWAARDELDQPRSPDAAGPALQRQASGTHTGRVIVDNLATKAIDSIVLAHLWGPSIGVISPQDRVFEAKRERATSAPGAVLSEAAIVARLRDDRRDGPVASSLIVTPLFETSIQTASIDVRLGPDFIAFRHSATGAFDPLEEQDPRLLQELVHKDWGEKFILHPGELVLAATLEYIVLPEDVAAQLVTRSSYGRLGLITATAVQIQPGSRGCITLELVNHAQTPIALSPGARIAQLMLFSVENPCPVKEGKYWFPTGPEFSKVHLDPDRKILEGIGARSRESGALGPLRFSAVIPDSQDEEFTRLAKAHGLQLTTEAAVKVPPDADGTSHRVGPESIEIAAILLAGSASLRNLAAFLYAWRRSRQGSIVVQERIDGSVEISSAPEHILPGLIIVRDRDGVTIREIGPEGVGGNIADALALLAGRRAKDGNA